MRFDDRVTGNLKTYSAPPINSRRHRPAELNKNVLVDWRLPGSPRRARLVAAAGSSRATVACLAHINGDQGDDSVRDIQICPTTVHLYARM